MMAGMADEEVAESRRDCAKVAEGQVAGDDLVTRRNRALASTCRHFPESTTITSLHPSAFSARS